MMASKTSGGLFSPQVRQVLSNISHRIFYHEPKAYDQLKDEPPGSEISTSLVLQMSMFFNACFFPFWLTSHALMLSIKYPYLVNTYQVILIAILVLFSFIEIIRLYLGFVGNLEEKVEYCLLDEPTVILSRIQMKQIVGYVYHYEKVNRRLPIDKAFESKAAELFGFLLLTILPQFPLVLFLLFNENAIVMPLERAVDIILTILIFVEIFSSYVAGRSMARQQATHFHLRQFIDLEQIQEEHEFIDPNAPRIVRRPTYRA